MKKIILITLLAIFLFSIIPNVSSAETFTPIMCNDYSFTCCSEKNSISNGQATLRYKSEHFECPSSSKYCDVTSFSGARALPPIYVGKQNCRIVDHWYDFPRVECDGEIFYTDIPISFIDSGSWIYQRGEWAIGVPEITLTYNAYIDRLDFCGRSGCSVGVPVPGADQCRFFPELNTIYSSGSIGSNIIGSKRSVSSFTVPSDQCVLSFVKGDRHICGYKEETCSYDTDCGGHTYDNKECTGRTLQTYGCVSYGQPVSDHDRMPTESGWGSDESQPTTGNADFGKRCEITSAVSVQCCQDQDCGSNFFCDISSFTCKETAQCSQDSDCGVSIRCDYSTLELKKPICKYSKCDFETTSIECCNDQNCDSESFCNEENKCERRTQPVTACPTECCENNPKYIDRPCPSERPFCVAGTCSSEDIGCNPHLVVGGLTIIPNLKQTCLGLSGTIVLIVALLVFFVSLMFLYPTIRKKWYKKKSEKIIAFIFALIISVLLAILIYKLFWIGVIVWLVIMLIRWGISKAIPGKK